MVEAIKWSPKTDQHGKEIKGCWLSEGGYTVNCPGGDVVRFMLTRPGESIPFAYTDLRGDVNKLVLADMRAALPEAVR